jgi:hypothetical protein
MRTLVVLGLVSTLLPGYALAVEIGNFTLNGYARQYLSFNLEDIPETTDTDDKYAMSMSRQQLLLQLRGPVGPAEMTAIARLDNEQITNYLGDLQKLTEIQGGRGNFRNRYNEADIRELFFDIPVGERLNLRLGKQQVVWGETDFFQAMDVVHGYDQTWRAFLEPENEEWRKPLILANATIDVPELDGSLQLVVRPGLDEDDDIGNTYDMFGGRWTQNGSRGFDLNGALLPIDYHNSEGDTDDAHYGGRWTGTLWDQDYSLNYYHTQAQNPVLAPTKKAVPNPWSLAYIYPEIDIYGGTMSGYIPAIDSVYRFEAAYVPDLFYNTAPFNQVIKKDTWRVMIGLDTNMRLQEYIGTSSPGMVSLQIFDTWIDDYDEDEFILNAFGTTEDEHTTWTTAILTFPYKNDTVIGQLVAVNDISNGGGVIVPSVELQFGPHWRVKFEADLFYGGTYNDTPNPAGRATLFGSFHNNDQFLTRITYQF